MAIIHRINGEENDPTTKAINALGKNFEAVIWKVWKGFQEKEARKGLKAIDPSIVYKVLVFALMKVAATGAVDCGITDMQLVGMAKTLHDQTKANMPRFS